MYRRGSYARDLNSGAPIRFVQFVPRFFPRCPLYSFIISMVLTLTRRVGGAKTISYDKQIIYSLAVKIKSYARYQTKFPMFI